MESEESKKQGLETESAEAAEKEKLEGRIAELEKELEERVADLGRTKSEMEEFRIEKENECMMKESEKEELEKRTRVMEEELKAAKVRA